MFSYKDIAPLLTGGCRISGNTDVTFNNVKPIGSSDEKTLSWIKASLQNPSETLRSSKAAVVVAPLEINIDHAEIPEKLLIQCDDPKLLFIRIASGLFGKRSKPGIHPTAIIGPDVTIGNNVYVGPHTIIEAGAIGNDSVIHGNCSLLGNVNIGERVIIYPGTTIGADGFGYSRNKVGILEKFPHFGGVVIRDDVEIGSNTCIDRGALADTVIGKGVKIDNLVHVAHNVEIGDHTMVIANSMIGGSTKIASGSWIAPSVSLINGISIGANSVIGMGAVVTKSVPPGETWAGSPARPLEELSRINRKLKDL